MQWKSSVEVFRHNVARMFWLGSYTSKTLRVLRPLGMRLGLLAGDPRYWVDVLQERRLFCPRGTSLARAPSGPRASSARGSRGQPASRTPHESGNAGQSRSGTPLPAAETRYGFSSGPPTVDEK